MEKRKNRYGLVAVLIALALLLGVGTGVFGALYLHDALPFGTSTAVVATPGTPPEESAPPPEEEAGFTALPLPVEMRAMWISFLEWNQVDFSGEGPFRADFAEMLDNCKELGMNTIIASVRPFGDALYESTLYPWSHLVHEYGLQGVHPGFDPLAVMIEEAHARQLRFEAWINPYRVLHPTNAPGALAAENPAVQNPSWAPEVGTGRFFDPGLPEVEALVVQGVAEILQNYEVDGIHFDDYFYPDSIDESFDADTYAQYGGALPLADWRRDNTARMVAKVHQTVHEADSGASFGISMQGNNENNYSMMYADVRLWMANESYVDYVMPQLYWGYAYRTQSGRDTYAYENILAQWAFFPRASGVHLYVGLGAYRIGLLAEDGTREGFGDGGNNEQAEWESGHNLADMVRSARAAGFSGFALFRYEFLFQPQDELAASECRAIAEALA